MEAIQAEMQKQFKIAARKKLYFALAVMFKESSNSLSETMQAVQELRKVMDKEDAPEGIEKLILGGLKRMTIAMRPVFCVSHALEEYKNAMGEYPEFARFVTHDPARLAESAKAANKMIDSTQELLNGLSDKENKAPNLRQIAFGDDFIKQCEKIKIKGE